MKNQNIYRFDGFLLDVLERKLQREGVPVRMGPKVFDALQFLLENAGMLVERRAIRERLWPGQIVEDGTLTRVIADLRKALGEDDRGYIETVPKFGYRFTAAVEVVDPGQSVLPAPESIPPTQLANPEKALVLPVPLTPPSKQKWMITAVGLICLAVVGFRIERDGPPKTSSGLQTLLILPFEVIGKGEDAEMFQLGLQDSLTMELSGLSGLAVIKMKPRADEAEDSAELGRLHRTRFVLAGTIQLRDDRMLVNARLIKSESGQTVWTQRFEQTRDDLFLIESQMARQTVAELIPALPSLEGEQLNRRLTSSGLAYRTYLLGRHYWNKRDASGYANAIAMFKKSIEADPQYAPAFVGLADSYMLFYGSRVQLTSGNSLSMAREAAEKAIQIDPSLGDAHATLGLIAENSYFDWDTAEREFHKAIRLAPNYLTGHHWYAEFLTMSGKFDQSEAEFEAARNLDPASSIVLTDLAQLYNFEKKYRRSLDLLDEVLKLDPSFHLAHNRKGYALMLMRRPEEALAEFQMADRQAGRKSWIGLQAWASAVAGKRLEAIELGHKAELDEPNPFLLSVIWAELGDVDRSMDWLQRVYDSRGAGLISLKVNPVFDRLRSNERFRALLRSMMM